MRMFESTDIYRVIFFKKAFFGVGVSVIYIPLPIFNRHIPTHKKQNRYQWKKTRHHNYGFSLNYSFHTVRWCLVYDWKNKGFWRYANIFLNMQSFHIVFVSENMLILLNFFEFLQKKSKKSLYEVLNTIKTITMHGRKNH